MRDTRSRN